MDLPATSTERFPVILAAFADHINTDCVVMDHDLAVCAIRSCLLMARKAQHDRVLQNH